MQPGLRRCHQAWALLFVLAWGGGLAFQLGPGKQLPPPVKALLGAGPKLVNWTTPLRMANTTGTEFAPGFVVRLARLGNAVEVRVLRQPLHDAQQPGRRLQANGTELAAAMAQAGQVVGYGVMSVQRVLLLPFQVLLILAVAPYVALIFMCDPGCWTPNLGTVLMLGPFAPLGFMTCPICGRG